ncbi:hypothetical protein CALCODRAFT_298557 [Calocera cornea HHB12733]|uniref:Uncharacterized protein n=1 Tax=Calocera cornea HHB12733 TaxID=1353952 RepID=A0A165FJF5_9BASI|nr:hypothetical protein CALCODRAFT_298557 [Calocera cornea HHB12733]
MPRAVIACCCSASAASSGKCFYCTAVRPEHGSSVANSQSTKACGGRRPLRQRQKWYWLVSFRHSCGAARLTPISGGVRGILFWQFLIRTSKAGACVCLSRAGESRSGVFLGAYKRPAHGTVDLSPNC